MLRLFFLGTWLLSTLTRPLPETRQIDDPPLASAEDRLVVFEGFLRPGCALSAATGPVIDQLAAEYASQAVFIEYNVDLAVSEERLYRWWSGYSQTSASMPLTMVDSGFRTHAGYTTLSYADHKAMVDEALARPPQAAVRASWERVGNQVRFTVDVTNQSGVTLRSDNFAAVHVIVYEDVQAQYTGRFMRAYAAAPIGWLADQEEDTFTITTPAMTGVDWNKLHFIALVDYQTDSAAFDMLQAVAATSSSVTSITAAPLSLTFRAPAGGSAPGSQAITLSGTLGESWTVSSSQDWLNVTPDHGTLPATVQASLDSSGLAPGVYTGELTFTSGEAETQVSALATIGSINWVHLPLTIR